MKVTYLNHRRTKRLPVGTVLISRREMVDVYDHPAVYVKTAFGWFSSHRITSTNQWVHSGADNWELREEVVSYGKWQACTARNVEAASKWGFQVEKNFDMSLISNEWHAKDHRIYLDARDVAIRKFLANCN